jgi:recombination protein RecA
VAKKKKAKEKPKSHGQLLQELADDFTGSHKDGEAILGNSPLLDSIVQIRIPTGCPNLDGMMQGGFPCGRVTQVYGNFSTGKSTFVQSGLIWCTRNDGVAVLIDPEVSFDPERFARMGGDPEKVILLQKSYTKPERKSKKQGDRVLPAMSVQDVFLYIRDILNSLANKPEWVGKPVFVGLDSLDNVTTNQALEGEKQGMTLKPRLIREGFRDISTPIAKTQAAFVIVSQIIEQIGSYHKGTQETSGGGGPKFISSIRLNTRRMGRYPTDESTGNLLIRTTATKSKLFRPYIQAVTAINNDSGWALEGIDPDYCLLYGCEESITTRGGWKYVIPTGELAQKHELVEGEEVAFQMATWREVIRRNPKIRAYLMDIVVAKYAKPSVFVEPEPDDVEIPDEG